ncbi:hypothetical protein TELCIR_10300 [Teladorsagia circumcincta]|uniref:Signal recognition particle receptor alpha subunit N-terminal domain-containing protein n=1 Tax=Teladorsagia circumcincta TaxID=45464 RepID=A0A2G9UCH7_TELCI|nr:hypothetical protein TELCIR_10300 [Teladorsagia circumcincta]
MIELFAIFTKGGFGLWAFQEGADRFVEAINAFVKDVLIQERALTQYKYNDMTIKFKLDNEFELVFVILYQYGQESFRHFESEFVCIRDDLMRSNVQSTGIPKKPRTFQESVKSQKTIDSMIISRPGDNKKAKKVEEAPKKLATEEVVV